MAHTATIPSKDIPGRQLTVGVLYTWQGAPGDVAHAYRGGSTGFLRSVCAWQRWTTTLVDGGRHCRDCTAVVEQELLEAQVGLSDPELELRRQAAARGRHVSAGLADYMDRIYDPDAAEDPMVEAFADWAERPR